MSSNKKSSETANKEPAEIVQAVRRTDNYIVMKNTHHQKLILKRLPEGRLTLPIGQKLLRLSDGAYGILKPNIAPAPTDVRPTATQNVVKMHAINDRSLVKPCTLCANGKVAVLTSTCCFHCAKPVCHHHYQVKCFSCVDEEIEKKAKESIMYPD